MKTIPTKKVLARFPKYGQFLARMFWKKNGIAIRGSIIIEAISQLLARKALWCRTEVSPSSR